jgi:hypothetical protein
MIRLMRIIGCILFFGSCIIGCGILVKKINDTDNTTTETYNTDDNKTSPTGTYVPGYVTLSGRYRKGHFRKTHSTSPNALKSRLRSQRYYHFKGGKQRRKLKRGN